MKVKKARINVTPLSDVAFTILITLMVTIPVISMTGSLKVSLPSAYTVEERNEEAISITITDDHRIEISWPDNPGGTETNWDGYIELLKYAVDNNPSMPVLIRADEYVYHGTVLSVIQVTKILGVDNISIATTQKGKD
ncbi:biopolymer transporter ExbD [candidate division WOR-3 bacterium]|nr:biopolymer transporter ExbD [candidate division WOR-3 bacterium]